MVNTLLKSMKMMTDVLILTLFFISIFALIGLQLFPGKLHDYHKDSRNWAVDIHTDEEIICGNSSTAW